MSLVASSACERAQDCELFRTCPDSLFQFAETLAGEKAATCRKCLEDRCETAVVGCSQNVKCNFSSRCMLTTSPSEYQKCLRDLYEGGFTFGHEERFPWEGEPNAFRDCLQKECRSECFGDPFICGETYDQYPDLRVQVAVRLYPDFKPRKKIKLRACEDMRGPPSENPEEWRRCTECGETDEHGVAGCRLPWPDVTADYLYFEIEGEPGTFPKTFYYPGRLGRDDLQLLAIYIVRTYQIEIGNDLLGRGYALNKDAGQSLVLTDSCVWEKISVPHLRLFVDQKDPVVRQCHEPEGRCDETGCPPCVWYAVDENPSLEAKQTDGTGAGIVGLPRGFYTINVEREHRDGGYELLAQRKRVRMEPGAMTIVRTWPLSENKRVRYQDAGAP